MRFVAADWSLCIDLSKTFVQSRFEFRIATGYVVRFSISMQMSGVAPILQFMYHGPGGKIAQLESNDSFVNTKSLN